MKGLTLGLYFLFFSQYAAIDFLGSKFLFLPIPNWLPSHEILHYRCAEFFSVLALITLGVGLSIIGFLSFCYRLLEIKNLKFTR